MTAPARFRRLRRLLGPSWLTSEGESGTIGWTLDYVLDGAVERVRVGRMAQMPMQGPDGTPGAMDALLELARSRRVVPSSSDTAKTLATKLRTWLDDADRRGHPFTVLARLAAYVGPSSSWSLVDARGNWFHRSMGGVETYTLDLANWNWDGPMGNRWARYWIVLRTHPWTGVDWVIPDGAGPYAADTWPALDDLPADSALGTVIPHSAVSAMRRIVGDQASEHAICGGVIVSADPTAFRQDSPGVNGTWASDAFFSGGTWIPGRTASPAVPSAVLLEVS